VLGAGVRTGAARGHRGYFHEAAFYRSDEELLDIVVPFLEDGVQGGEPTLVAFDAPNQRLVRSVLTDTAGITFLNGSTQYARPAAAIKLYRDLLASHVAGGARQIRVVGDVPHPGTGSPWDWWARYEATVNHAYEDFPLWGLCPYDTRTTPAGALCDVARTHPWIASADGEHRENDAYEDPTAFLAQLDTGQRDPLESAPPSVELLNPSPSSARKAVVSAARDSRVPAAEIEDLTIAVSEIVANAFRHGLPPVLFRLWTGEDRLVVAVTDRGPGVSDPFAGLVPVRPGSPGGRGLWIAHQLCEHVTMSHDGEGFTIRLAAGAAGVAG
jgi:anti-sigma regulatory factor (Ser/Thr protein kinase)